VLITNKNKLHLEVGTSITL